MILHGISADQIPADVFQNYSGMKVTNGNANEYFSRQYFLCYFSTVSEKLISFVAYFALKIDFYCDVCGSYLIHWVWIVHMRQ